MAFEAGFELGSCCAGVWGVTGADVGAAAAGVAGFNGRKLFSGACGGAWACVTMFESGDWPKGVGQGKTLAFCCPILLTVVKTKK